MRKYTVEIAARKACLELCRVPQRQQGFRAMINREKLQLQIAAQSLAIALIQQRLKSTSMSASTRQELENELLDRVHLRFVALNTLRLMTTTG